MLAEIETLLIIQDRDLRIQSMKNEVATNIPRLIEHANSRLHGDEAALAKVKEEIQANEMAMKTLELDIQTRQNTITRLKVQQYETRKNVEFRAMGDEIKRYGGEVTGLEDQELVLMEKGEVLAKRLADCKAQLAKTRLHVDDELKQLEERRNNDEGAIAELESERAGHAGKVPPDLLQIYERILKKKQDRAVAPLEGGQCKGCHMKVTSTTAIKTRAGKEITHCEQCGRILYAED